MREHPASGHRRPSIIAAPISIGRPVAPSAGGMRSSASVCSRGILYAQHGFGDQPIDDGIKRLGAGRAIGDCPVEHRDLAMGARPAGEDLTRMVHLAETSEMAGILFD